MCPFLLLSDSLGQAAARSHTGALASEDRVVDAFLDDRQAADLLVQPGVLDGDAGMQREEHRLAVGAAPPGGSAVHQNAKV